MKNYLLYILVTSLILFSCAREAKQENDMATDSNNKSANTAENLKQEGYFSLDTNSRLTNEQKEAYQVRAIQKLYDFLDYIKIISDHKIAEKFKNQSADLALRLFVNDSTIIAYPELTGSNEYRLNNFLIHIKNYKKAIKISVKKAEFTTPLTADSLSNYNGIMEVIFKMGKTKQTKNIAVHLINIKKNFGEVEKNTAEIRLGDIY